MEIIPYLRSLRKKIGFGKKEEVYQTENSDIERKVLEYELAVDIYKNAVNEAFNGDEVKEEDLKKAVAANMVASKLSTELFSPKNVFTAAPYMKRIEGITNDYAIATLKLVENGMTMLEKEKESQERSLKNQDYLTKILTK